MRNNASEENIWKDCWELYKIDERHQARDSVSLFTPENKWFEIYTVNKGLISNLDPEQT